MLNKKVCEKCILANNEKDFLDHLNWNKVDKKWEIEYLNIRWRQGGIWCWKKAGGYFLNKTKTLAFNTKINKLPPEECPFQLEHIVMKKAKAK